jgi:dsDNA-specific endonuclease/ATPase MutS2
MANRLAEDAARWLAAQSGGSMEDDQEPVRIPITEVFDLHTVHPKEVAAVVEAYLEEASRLGLKSLRLVHGRGRGVQRQIVRSVLARTPSVAAFHDAPPELGGWGATVVRLR